MPNNEEEKEIILLTAKCLINLYNQLMVDDSIDEFEEFDKELGHLITASVKLLKDARAKKVIIPKEDRHSLYRIIHH